MADYPLGIGPDLTPVTPKTSGNSSEDLTPQTFSRSGGSAKGFKYNVEKLQYPLYVGSEDDLQHYMVFFINIRDKSKWFSQSKTTEVTPMGQNRLTSQGQVSAGTKALGAGIGLSLAGLALQNNNKTVVDKVIKIGALGIGAGVGAEVTNIINEKTGFFEPSKMGRLDTAIMLAVNEKPSVHYGVGYEGKDLGTLMGYLAGGVGATDMLHNQRNAELARAIALNVANIPSGVAQLFGANLDIPSSIQSGTGFAPNPFREQVFRNVETRTFQFDYKFLPRSETEAANIQNIIKQFKFHMHPEISGGGLFYIYPSTFDIAYYFKGKQNNNLHKISTCVLENLSIDYGGQGWNTFSDGMPTEINMRLKFRELEVLTKERIEKGY